MCRHYFSFFLLLVSTWGCSKDTSFGPPPTFERPGPVAFFCYDLTERALKPLVDCQGLSGTEDDTRALTALVAQTARGELAAVDLRLGEVIDADIRVPGYTFVRVGEIPTGIVVPENQPGVTYVSSFGSRQIEYYATADFRQDVDAPAISEPGVVPLDGAPVDLVISKEEDVLFAALPELSSIAIIPIHSDRTLSTATILPITVDSFPEPVLPPMQGGEYQRICLDGASGEAQVRAPHAGDPRTTDIDPTEVVSRPARLRVDGDQLLVSDSALPLIHRYEINGTSLVALPPLFTGAPIQDFDLTPEVPTATDSEMSDVSRFLYAIDARDGSVLVLDILEGSETWGAVLPVRSGDGPWDRIQLLDRARTLTVLTPGFPGVLCDPENPAATGGSAPDSLRGVFVAVGLGNGVVQIVDVFDRDARCRGGLDCQAPADDRERRVFIRRHSARLGALITTGEFVSGTPRFAYEGNPGRLDERGEVTGSGPGLQPFVQGCPRFQEAVFPEGASDPQNDLAPVICATTEPWGRRQENWEAIWEGTIPGTTTLARFEDDSTRLQLEGVDLCSRGVLGTRNVEFSQLQDEDPEQGYKGDQLFVVTDPPESAHERVECEPFFADENGEREEVAIDLLEVSQTQVVVQDPNRVLDCYRLPEDMRKSVLFRFEVRTREAFSVIGRNLGFLHRVVSNGDGICVVDRMQQPISSDSPASYRNARAFADRLFLNPYVSFQVAGADVLNPDDRAVLSFVVGNVPSVLAVDVGSNRGLTSLDRVIYGPTDQSLYAVDANSDGLVRYHLDPFDLVKVFQ